jgi:peptide/nickel transport system permease protein
LIPPVLFIANFIGYAYARLAQRIQLARNPFLALEGTKLPLLEDYGAYLLRLLHFDLGAMPGGEGTILQTLLHLGRNSLGLITVAFVFSVAIGYVMGLGATRHSPPGVANWLTGVSTFGQAIPSFYTGSLLIVGSLVYAIKRGTGEAPPLPLNGFGWDLHMVMPVIALMTRPTVTIAQFTANMLSEELRKQYVVAARSTGHTWRDVRWRLAMKNVLAGVILTVAASARFLVVEVIVVEWLFGWEGTGRLFAQTLVPSTVISMTGVSIGEQLFLNAPLIAAMLMGMVGVFLMFDLVASILGQNVDARLRVAEEAAIHG